MLSLGQALPIPAWMRDEREALRDEARALREQLALCRPGAHGPGYGVLEAARERAAIRARLVEIEEEIEALA